MRAEIEDRRGASFKLTFKQINMATSQTVAPGQLLRIASVNRQKMSWSFQIEMHRLEQVDDHWQLHGLLVEPTVVSEVVQMIKLVKNARS